MENKIIGSKIAEARKKINLSQAQLAQSVFVSPQAVGKWERGESFPDIITFNRLAKILGVDLNYFSENLEPAAMESSMFQEKQSAESHDYRAPSANPDAKPRWDMSRGNWADADFSGLKNLHEKFSSSNMQRCKFIGSDLSELLLKNNNVDSCDFSESDISNSQIQGSHLGGNIFRNCSLKGTEFSGSYATGCDFTGADLTRVVVKSGGFEKNTFANTVWDRTSFIDTMLSDITFDGKVEDCSFENCAFKKVTFQNAILINTFFKCKTLKRLRFVDCKADRMTYEFLKNGKADLSGITLLNT